jgi:hypothetical protein
MLLSAEQVFGRKFVKAVVDEKLSIVRAKATTPARSTARQV